MNATTCTACKALTPVGIQCNHHRRVEPNERTLMQREMSAYMAETGCTPAEAEAHFGVTAGVTVGA
jgi:hypothetical protein